jgi:predicted ribosome quality control (RQC) complex YloA/Tae2 family protein
MRPSPTGRIGDVYEKSDRQTGSAKRQTDLVSLIKRGDSSPSETADRYFTSLGTEKLQAARIASARADLRRKMSQQERLLSQLQNDLREHESPEDHKRIGDLLLANLTTAKRDGNRVALIDYFAEDAPTLDVEIDAAVSLQEEAARRFGRYARSKRALEQINKRMQTARSRLGELIRAATLKDELRRVNSPLRQRVDSSNSPQRRNTAKRKNESGFPAPGNTYLVTDSKSSAARRMITIS